MLGYGLMSDGQTIVLEALSKKFIQSNTIDKNLTQNLNSTFKRVNKEFNAELIKPICRYKNGKQSKRFTHRKIKHFSESDCMLSLPTLEDKSLYLSRKNPPFAGLYNYSSSEHDMQLRNKGANFYYNTNI